MAGGNADDPGSSAEDDSDDDQDQSKEAHEVSAVSVKEAEMGRWKLLIMAFYVYIFWIRDRYCPTVIIEGGR